MTTPGEAILRLRTVSTIDADEGLRRTTGEAADHRARSLMPGFVWLSMLPFGLGAWAPALPGVRLRRPLWVALAALWSVLAVAGWVLAILTDGDSGGILIIAGWLGAVITALAIRPAYAERVETGWDAAKHAARERLSERSEAIRMAAEDPAMARELGVGRPDVPGASPGGVVDVNHADRRTLTTLPGVDDAIALRIVKLREELNGVGSLAELGELADLDAYAVERLRGLVVFLPR